MLARCMLKPLYIFPLDIIRKAVIVRRMNKAAQALGRMARGVKKTLTPAQRKAAAERASRLAEIRWKGHVKTTNKRLLSAASRGNLKA